MKQLSAKTKIVSLIIILIIVVGVAVTIIKGFNFDIRNQQSQMVQVYLGKQSDLKDLRTITNEVFGKQPVLIQKVEVFEDQVAFTSKEITDEQKTNLVNKINEKYETEIKAEEITTENIPHTKLRDIVKPYILPFVISTVAILIYMATRFYKLGILKTLLKTVGIVTLVELVLFNLMAITRFPIGRYTLPLVLFTYLVTMLGITIDLENKLKNESEKEE